MATNQQTKRAKAHFFSEIEDIDKLFKGRKKKAIDIIELLKPFLSKMAIKRALSIGSSYCIIEDEIKKKVLVDAEFICTDMDNKALNHFDQPQLKKELKSATDLDYPNEYFGFIFLHQVLEHINEYPSVIKQLKRVCEPKGLIYINVPNPFSPMIGKLPNGEWPKPFIKSLVMHIAKKCNKDFFSNTEKYHTGFSIRYLRKMMPEFTIYDLRKSRLKQEFRSRIIHLLIDLFPSSLLFVFIETNIWCLVKK